MSHDNLNVASSWILFILFARHTSHDGVKLVEVECSNKFLKKIKMIFWLKHWGVRAWNSLTLQNWIPLTELPRVSRGGDQSATHITLGITNNKN